MDRREYGAVSSRRNDFPPVFFQRGKGSRHFLRGEKFADLIAGRLLRFLRGRIAVHEGPVIVNDERLRPGVLLAEGRENLVHAVVVFEALAEADGIFEAGHHLFFHAADDLLLKRDGDGAVIDITHGRHEAGGKGSHQDQDQRINACFFFLLRHSCPPP